MIIKINNKDYQAELGETVLDVCKREGIRIPTLCAHGKLKREAVCRLCLVETNKTADRLVTSCTTRVCEGLEVTTESERIKKAREINMELLWSDHAGKCATCKKNRRCELQILAEEYKIENFHFIPRKGSVTDAEERDLLRDNKSRVVVDDKNPVIHRTTEFCIECRRCINICPVKAYGFNHRAGDVVVGTPYNETLDCLFCGACVKHCPTGALTDQNDLDKIMEKLDDLKIMAVAILDPAILESVKYEFDSIKGEEQVIGLLRSVGFEKVFSLSWGMKEYALKIKDELGVKKNNQALISSYCPAFSRYISKNHPHFKNNIAKTEIPDELLAEAIKNDYAKAEKINPKDIVVISISSCTAKKAEKYEYLDYVVSVRELGRIARKKNIKEVDLEVAKYNNYFKESKVSRKLIESGELLKSVKCKNGLVANSMEGFAGAMSDVKKTDKKIDFIEGMICPGGCMSGGGCAIKLK
jgi:iron only hydrogenase large subunit-like protein